MRICPLLQAETDRYTTQLPVYDFGRVWEGWQAHRKQFLTAGRARFECTCSLEDKVHPLSLPGGFAYGWPLLHHLKMEDHKRKARSRSWANSAGAAMSNH